MPVQDLSLYLSGWYIIATMVAFIAALLFWNKGEASSQGNALGFGLKITGSGAIFVTIIIISYLINPFQKIINGKSLFIIYQSKDPPISEGSLTSFTISPSNIDSELDFFRLDKAYTRLVPVDSTYDLSPKIDRPCLTTRAPIPKGKYFISFKYVDTGETKEYLIKVPEDGESD